MTIGLPIPLLKCVLNPSTSQSALPLQSVSPSLRIWTAAMFPTDFATSALAACRPVPHPSTSTVLQTQIRSRHPLVKIRHRLPTECRMEFKFLTVAHKGPHVLLPACLRQFPPFSQRFSSLTRYEFLQCVKLSSILGSLYELFLLHAHALFSTPCYPYASFWVQLECHFLRKAFLRSLIQPFLLTSMAPSTFL